MKKFLAGALATIALAVSAVLFAAHAGLVDIAADVEHNATLAGFVVWAREQSIARRSSDIAVPADLAGSERVRRGAGNYAAMCASCHLAPGIADSELRKGLSPPPPSLIERTVPAAAPERIRARQFRIIKHGVAATGMPAWGKVGMLDSEIWDLVAFLQVLPTLDAEQYRLQVAASDGHSHASADLHAKQAAKRNGKAHEHSGHSH